MSATRSGIKPRTGSVAYIALGSNLGDRLGYLRAAVEGFARHPDLGVCAVSDVYESEAHTLSEGEEAPDFLNAVIAVASTRSPEALLEVCLELESEAGRDRHAERDWAPRTLDCDLLVVDGEARDSPDLQLPHPRLHERRFVLEPLADLAPNLYIPPPHDATVRELLARCPDTQRPQRLSVLLFSSSTTDT